MYLNSPTLSTEQEETVNGAAELLTKEQKEQMKRCQDKITTQDIENNAPGTSKDIGKTIDPREWGNAGIATEELNVDIQKAILDAYERGYRAKKSMARTPKNRTKGSAKGSENKENVHQLSPVPKCNSIALLGHAQVLESQRTRSHPAAQIVPSSGLGVALGNIA